MCCGRCSNTACSDVYDAYATRYPHDVAGLVFVDASSPTQDIEMPAAMRALDEHSDFEVALLKASIRLDLARAVGMCDQATRISKRRQVVEGGRMHPARIDVYQGEVAGWSVSLLEAAKTGHYRDLPILVFSRDPVLPPPPQLPASVRAAEWQQANVIWGRLQQALAQLSTRGRRIIAKGSSHYIQYDRPDVLNHAVPVFIQQIRDGSIPASDGRVQIE